MLLKLAAPIVEINGKIGNNIYRNGRNGQYMTPGVYKHHVPSRKQLDQRWFFFRAVRFASKNPNVPLHYDCWWIWSYNHPIKNKKTETMYMTPFLACVKYNIERQIENLPMRHCPFHLL